MTPYRIEFTLMGLPRTPNSRRHWRSVHKDNAHWYFVVKAAVGNRKPVAPFGRDSEAKQREEQVRR